MARPTGLEPVTYGLAYLLRLSPPLPAFACNVWGLDYIFTVSGGTRIVSTDPVYLIPTIAVICHRKRTTILQDLTGFLGIAISRSILTRIHIESTLASLKVSPI